MDQQSLQNAGGPMAHEVFCQLDTTLASLMCSIPLESCLMRWFFKSEISSIPGAQPPSFSCHAPTYPGFKFFFKKKKKILNWSIYILKLTKNIFLTLKALHLIIYLSPTMKILTSGMDGCEIGNNGALWSESRDCVILGRKHVPSLSFPNIETAKKAFRRPENSLVILRWQARAAS